MRDMTTRHCPPPARSTWTTIARLRTVLLALCLATPIAAQNIISVPFTQGVIGTRGSSSGTANNVLTFQTLGIARTFFIQSSSTTTFELQGNDIPGTLRIVRTNGAILDIPASANWRNSGGTTYLLGILPRPATPITYNYAGGSISITDGSVNGGTSVGNYIAGYAGATLADGDNTSGNAAQSQLLTALNDYLATVVGSRPAGPLTVTAQNTTSTTPTIAGNATLAVNENLSVIVAGAQYSTSTTPAVTVGGGTWSLTLASPLSLGTYDVAATITNADGFTLSDATINELVISAPTTTLTIGGSFTPGGKTYDGTSSATAGISGLSLVGINGSDDVTIAAATFAFSTAAAGTGRTVSITSVTLGGAQAGS
ncbi:MAG TPA: YDG domain-containing protein, partial [Gemmatimonadaceae bacterium]|nr:YDG domain-containing protein [Gemmatimonadaceae bacterium]